MSAVYRATNAAYSDEKRRADLEANAAKEAEAERDEARREVEAADNLLRRLAEWDVMQVTADGNYWKQEIAYVRKRLAALSQPNPECEHGWVDARNEVVKSGYFCRKCGALLAGSEDQPPQPNPTESARDE